MLTFFKKCCHQKYSVAYYVVSEVGATSHLSDSSASPLLFPLIPRILGRFIVAVKVQLGPRKVWLS